MNFHAVELRCLCQASEDIGRVRRAMALAIGVAEAVEGAGAPGDAALAAAVREAGLAEEHTGGQFHNPIVILTCRLKRSRDIRAFWRAFARNGPEAVAGLADDADGRMDEGVTFHFRLDKQEAYLGRLVLGSGGDTIAVRCKPEVYSGGRTRAVEDMSDFLRGLPEEKTDGGSRAVR
jgi:RNA binding exosome subunit